MRYKLNGLIIFMCIICFTGYSQVDIVTPIDTESEVVKFVTRNSGGVKTNDGGLSQKQNAVYIQQIGQSNKIISYSQTENGSISVQQDGNNNRAGLFLKAQTIEYNLSQSGDDNKYLHFNISTPDLIKVNAVQQGKNTDIIIHGKNSISEKLKINMKGNDRSLIIRNFN